jgi:L-histidine N-alpha-methyltransferase
MLRDAARAISQEYPQLGIHGVVGDFDRHLSKLPRGGRRLIALLGGTIGNYKPQQRARFLREIASGMEQGDTFLLGTDLVKDHSRLHAAYNDEQGVTAAFNRNVLSVINRELGADFEIDAFDHVAWFDPQNAWIEMLLRAKKAQKVRVSSLGLEVSFSQDEAVRTEVSCKFRPDQVERELADAGLRLLDWWTDGAGDYGLSLSTRRAEVASR